jgi:hypothetical protein
MSTHSDILRKLDALLNKHRTAEPDPSEIPVLTEAVEKASPTGPIAQSAMPAAAPQTDLSDAEVEALAKDIYKRVMAKLNTQISSDLREHLTQRLSSIIDSTVGAAVADFKQELANTVGDAIAEALLDRAEKMALPDDSHRT